MMANRETTVRLVTYCSRDKDHAAGLVPAVDRYLSPRIGLVQGAASELDAGFLILSGLFGLMEASDPIPDYDHLLTSEQVPSHAVLMAGQLRTLGVKKIIFVTRSRDVDPGAMPYRESILGACTIVGAHCRVVELPVHELSCRDFADMVAPLLDKF